MKEAEVFLIDHAWTFSPAGALEQLMTNQALFDRMTKIVEAWDKQDLPNADQKPTVSIQTAFEQELAKGGKSFCLDNLGIEDLTTLPFPEQTEEVSLFDNQIMNPKFIVDCLVPLPNLKALWLNNNPVVDACSNFHAISELMPNLEICNSVLTA